MSAVKEIPQDDRNTWAPERKGKRGIREWADREGSVTTTSASGPAPVMVTMGSRPRKTGKNAWSDPSEHVDFIDFETLMTTELLSSVESSGFYNHFIELSYSPIRQSNPATELYAAWERALTAIGSISADDDDSIVMAPSDKTKADLHALVQIVKNDCKLPEFVLDDSVGSVSLRWSKIGDKAYLAMTCSGDGTVIINGRASDRQSVVSDIVPLSKETEILEITRHNAFKKLVS